MTVRSGGLPLSNTRTSLPQIKSKFDLEPNPFEQSFKGNSSTDPNHPSSINLNSPSSPFNHLLNTSQSNHHHHQFNRHRRARSSSPHHHSTSNPDCHLSPPLLRNTPGGSLVKVSLPGIASIASHAILNNLPSDQSRKSTSPPSISAASSSSHQSNHPITAISPFGWGFSSLAQDSLRTGPLSPALLNGPARNSLPTHTALNSLIGLGTPTNDAFTPGTSALLAIFSTSTSDPPLSNTITSDDYSHTSPAPAISSSFPNLTPTSLNLTSQPLQPSKSSIVQDSSLTRPSSSLQPSRPSPSAISQSLSLSTSLQSSDQNSVLRSQSILPNPLITSNEHLAKAVTPILPTLITTSGTTPLLLSNTNDTLNELHRPLQNIKKASVSPALASTRLPLQPSNHPHHPSVQNRPSTSKSPIMPQPAHVPPLVYPPYLASSTGIFHNTQPTPTSASSIDPNSTSTLESPLSAQATHNYDNNPLLLLHDSIAHHQQQEQLMDDATVTAANALTGLVNSRSGSRYSSPGPASSSSTHPHPVYLNTSPQSTQHSLYSLSHSHSHLQPPSKIGMSTNNVPGPSVPYQMMSSNGTSTMMIKSNPLYSSSKSSIAMKPSIESSPSTLNPKNNRRTNGDTTAGLSSKKNGKRKKEEEEEETHQPEKGSQKARKDPLESHGNYDETMNGNGNDSDSDGNDWGGEDGGMNERGSVNGKGAGGGGGGGKGETEEEKRKNFLERNRQAALKCRQRKKAWLANLQTKVESLERENEGLEMTIGRLREEVESIRSILLVHHDECSIRVGNGREMNIGELIRGGIGTVLRGHHLVGSSSNQNQNQNQNQNSNSNLNNSNLNQALNMNQVSQAPQGGQGYGY